MRILKVKKYHVLIMNKKVWRLSFVILQCIKKHQNMKSLFTLLFFFIFINTDYKEKIFQFI